GAKRKVTKRETPKMFRALRSATKAARLGWAPTGVGAMARSRAVRSRLVLWLSRANARRVAVLCCDFRVLSRF
ncbi:MAG: hypothetical protein IIX80_03255, partial [Clostridia bacterium]|nr:hypothetical protein [Clostridia bacterium]